MKFIHTADIHLGAALKSASFSRSGIVSSRREELKETFYDIIAAAQDMDLFFISGDVFDDARVKPTFVFDVFDRLKALRAHVFIVLGNHDAFLRKPSYASLFAIPNIHFFTSENHRIALDGIDVIGFNTHDFDRQELFTLAENLNPDKKNVLCLHGDVSNKQDPHYLTALADIRRLPFDYVALGHIHKHAVLAPHIAYPGNPEPLDFSETDEKGYIEGTLNTTTRIRFVPRARRRFRVETCTLQGKETRQDVIDKLEKINPAQRQKDLFRIVLNGTTPDFAIDDLENMAADVFHYVEFRDETRSEIHLQTLKKSYPDTLVSHMIEAFENNPDDTDEASLILALEALLEDGGA